jgi:hypothetical protein
MSYLNLVSFNLLLCYSMFILLGLLCAYVKPMSECISNKQYGFLKGRSTAIQLLHMLDKWTEFLEEGGQIDVILS